MISQSSIDNLVTWRKEAMSRLAQIRKHEVALQEIFRPSVNALRQARYQGKEISWDDREAVLKMLEDIVTGVTKMMTLRSADLELLLGHIDKLAKAELPPGTAWEWPSNDEAREH